MIRPFGDHVVLRRIDKDEVTAGGIIIVGSATEPDKIALRGEILAVGPGRMLDSGQVVPTDSSVGDVVAFSQYGGTEFELSVGGDKLVLISDRDIFGAIEELTVEGIDPRARVTIRDGCVEVRG